MVMLALEAGTVARVRAIISGTNVAPPPPSSLIPGADNIALAWVIFFIILALVYVREPGPERGEQAEPEAFEDDIEPEPEPEVRVVMTNEPPATGKDSVPAVPNVPEAQAWLDKGNELHAMGHHEEALAHFDEALKLHPRLAGAWVRKGLACNALGQYQEAIRCCDEALRLDPRDAAVWHDKGNALCAVGRLEGALNCFNEALVIDPRDERAWYNKGVCLANLGRAEEAISCCNKATKLDPSFAVAWEAKAMTEERLGRIQDAVAAYRQFIALASASDAAAVERVQRHVSALEVGPQAET